MKVGSTPVDTLPENISNVENDLSLIKSPQANASKCRSQDGEIVTPSIHQQVAKTIDEYINMVSKDLDSIVKTPLQNTEEDSVSNSKSPPLNMKQQVAKEKSARVVAKKQRDYWTSKSHDHPCDTEQNRSLKDLIKVCRRLENTSPSPDKFSSWKPRVCNNREYESEEEQEKSARERGRRRTEAGQGVGTERSEQEPVQKRRWIGFSAIGVAGNKTTC